ncbi:DeoR/GlpR family DNA-binding transcription regulator [Nakamurella endophytica]|uniref:DeoR family transcriptional regulator n=1 Tax=Nakamurella endophytica TaxID=1748367 RepID=A0A917SZ89_9ACTN|nr:DeoR/GlpR family DNA-binding transcription regulator [Nakamurella endophytica]GGM02403.1 DeoR family transcriptional regulator [Nakamurella endophytica]
MVRRTSRERRADIVRWATQSGPATVEQLSDLFDVTASTIRRDLAALTAAGKLARTYGGAMALVAHPEAPLRRRTGQALEAKQAIGRWAAGQVRRGETVVLDAGSTTGEMARALGSARDIVVATTGLNALNELSDAPDVTLLALGGRLRPLSQGFVGPLTEASLERMTFDRAFLGADGVTADRGICEADLEQTRQKEIMMRRADRVYVLAHGAKLGRRPFHAWAVMPDRWTLVTDRGAEESDLRPFRDRGVEVVVVDVDPGPERNGDLDLDADAAAAAADSPNDTDAADHGAAATGRG